MGAEPVVVAEEARPLYHAALAHGANHLVTLVAEALDLLPPAGSSTRAGARPAARRRPSTTLCGRATRRSPGRSRAVTRAPSRPTSRRSRAAASREPSRPTARLARADRRPGARLGAAAPRGAAGAAGRARRPPLGRRQDRHAAPAGAGVEDDRVLVVRSPPRLPQQFEVEVADGVRVPLRQPVERAVARAGCRRAGPGAARTRESLDTSSKRARLRAEFPAGVPCQAHQRVACGLTPARAAPRRPRPAARRRGRSGARGRRPRPRRGSAGTAWTVGPPRARVRPVRRRNSTASRPSSASRSRWNAVARRDRPSAWAASSRLTGALAAASPGRAGPAGAGSSRALTAATRSDAESRGRRMPQV